MVGLNLNELPGDRFLAFLFGIFALFIPGAGYLYLTDVNNFFTYGYFRFFFLSIYYSVPLLIIGIFLFTLSFPQEYKEKEKVFALIFGASIISLLSFYLSAVAFNGLRIVGIKFPLPFGMYCIALGGMLTSVIINRKKTITTKK